MEPAPRHAGRAQCPFHLRGTENEGKRYSEEEILAILEVSRKERQDEGGRVSEPIPVGDELRKGEQVKSQASRPKEGSSQVPSGCLQALRPTEATLVIALKVRRR